MNHSIMATPKKQWVLGVSALYHDSAACLLCDGKIIAAAPEEMFSRIKHDPAFPAKAVRWCLEYACITSKDLDLVVFYEKPFLKFERILENALRQAPLGLGLFCEAMPLWLKQKIWIKDIIASELGFKGNIVFANHHESHAASAFYPSPFKTAAFLTIDGVGEWETCSFGIGRSNTLEVLQTQSFPHSLGLLYSTFTYYAGFKVNSGEYKLMGLAPYGKPKYQELILKELIDVKPDGSFRLNMKYFGFGDSLRMITPAFERLLGGPPRIPEGPITQRDMDIASSIQTVLEDVVLKIVRHVHQVTGQENLCLAGGVALNCVVNGRILREGPFKRVWVQPASSDAGGALGAALIGRHHYLGQARLPIKDTACSQAIFLGPSFSDAAIERVLSEGQYQFKRYAYEAIPAVTAGLIARQNVVGWFQGRAEFGPRALGGRCILADARSPTMQSQVNSKIKRRESFRPFAPSVLDEHAAGWFELQGESPYMLFTANVREDKCVPVLQIPAVTHVDRSARVQTIKEEDHALFYDMINAFYLLTGTPLVLNTSFNVRGAPMVHTPKDALDCFMSTGMDFLVIGCFVLDKKEQANDR